MNFNDKSNNHFIAFVSYLDKIEDCQVTPEIHIVPSGKIEELMYHNPKGNRQGINLSKLREMKKYRDNWKQLY
jgi:hypothetical protein